MASKNEQECVGCEKCSKSTHDYHRFEDCDHVVCTHCLPAPAGKNKTAIEFDVLSVDCPVCQASFLFPGDAMAAKGIPTFSHFALFREVSSGSDTRNVDDTYPKFCSHHTDVGASHVCKRCNVMICDECLSRHQDASHEVIGLPAYITELKEFIVGKFSAVNESFTKLTTYRKELETEVPRAKATLGNATSQVEESVKGVLEKITSERDGCLTEIMQSLSAYGRRADTVSKEIVKEINALSVYRKIQQAVKGENMSSHPGRIVRLAEFLHSNESILRSSLCQARYILEETEIILAKSYEYVDNNYLRDYDEARAGISKCGRILSKTRSAPVLVFDSRTSTDDDTPFITSICPCSNGDLIVADSKNLKVKCFMPVGNESRKYALRWENAGNDEAKLRWPKYARQSSDGSRVIVSDQSSYICKEFDFHTGAFFRALSESEDQLHCKSRTSNTECCVSARPTGDDSELPWPIVKMAFGHGYVLPKLLALRKLFPMKSCYSLQQDMFVVWCRELVNDKGIMVISNSGEPLRSVYLDGLKPCDISVTPDAHILLLDTASNRVVMLKKTGEIVGYCLDQRDGIVHPVFIRASRESHNGRYGVYLAENDGVIKVYSLKATHTLPRTPSITRHDPGY